MLYVTAAVHALGALVSVAEMKFTPDPATDEPIPLWLALLLMLYGLSILAALVLTATFFIQWQRRTYMNLSALGARNLQTTPGWVGWYWFIPIGNLFKPFQATKEIYHLSDPSDPAPNGGMVAGKSAPGFLSGWWACWLIGNVVTNIGQKMANPNAPGSAVEAAYVVDILASALLIGAALLAVKVIREIEARQQARLNLMPT